MLPFFSTPTWQLFLCIFSDDKQIIIQVIGENAFGEKCTCLCKHTVILGYSWMLNKGKCWRLMRKNSEIWHVKPQKVAVAIHLLNLVALLLYQYSWIFGAFAAFISCRMPEHIMQMWGGLSLRPCVCVCIYVHFVIGYYMLSLCTLPPRVTNTMTN